MLFIYVIIAEKTYSLYLFIFLLILVVLPLLLDSAAIVPPINEQSKPIVFLVFVQ